MKYHVKRKSMRQICLERGVSYTAWVNRVYVLGMDREEAMTKPVRNKEFVQKRINWVKSLKKQGLTTKDIAKKVGLTTVRVCQILKWGK